jgi:hypothetical protein
MPAGDRNPWSSRQARKRLSTASRWVRGATRACPRFIINIILFLVSAFLWCVFRVFKVILALTPLASALRHLHSLGIAHGDLKPQKRVRYGLLWTQLLEPPFVCRPKPLGVRDAATGRVQVRACSARNPAGPTAGSTWRRARPPTTQPSLRSTLRSTPGRSASVAPLSSRRGPQPLVKRDHGDDHAADPRDDLRPSCWGPARELRRVRLREKGLLQRDPPAKRMTMDVALDPRPFLTGDMAPALGWLEAKQETRRGPSWTPCQ